MSLLFNYFCQSKSYHKYLSLIIGKEWTFDIVQKNSFLKKFFVEVVKDYSALNFAVFKNAYS